MHSRRTVLAALAAHLLMASRSATAQQPARVGWLQMYSTGMYADLTARGFIRGLRESGYEEGRNLVFEKRSAEGDLRRLGALAREIVAARVDVLFAPAKPLADAAWYASRSIPTVIATVTDPVTVGYAVSLARPGKHITGVTTANAELIGKRLQLLTELVPGLTRVGTFIDADLLASCQEEVDLLEQAAAKLGLTIVRIPVTANGFDAVAALKRATAARVQAVITLPMTSNHDITGKVAEHALSARMPFMHDVPQLAQSALAVYGPDFEDIFRRAGHYTARLLKGAKPETLPIEEPREFRLIVNLKVAKALGLKVSHAMMIRAGEVIE